MPPIPETGGGLSGFLAHYLWRLYRHFPSSGRWDWVLLIILLVCTIRVLFLPYLWKSVRSDLRHLQEHESAGGNQAIWTWAWDIAYMWFLAWFFQTEAGRTFLDGRHGTPTEVRAGLSWLLALLACGLFLATGAVVEAVEKRNRALAVPRPEPYPDRGFLSLFGGGGVFCAIQNENTENSHAGSVLWLEGMTIALHHLFYWYWSAASVTVFLAMLFSGAATEVVRMGFVSYHHKQTFG